MNARKPDSAPDPEPEPESEPLPVAEAAEIAETLPPEAEWTDVVEEAQRRSPVGRVLDLLKTGQGAPVAVTQAEYEEAKASVLPEQRIELDHLYRKRDIHLIENLVEGPTLDERTKAQEEGLPTLDDEIEAILKEGRK